MAKVRARGRPPAGRDAAGEPLKTSTDYIQLTARVSPSKKALLKDLASVQRTTQTEILERALDLYAESLSAAERKALQALSAANPDSKRR